jgi:general secretion pathway protein L
LSSRAVATLVYRSRFSPDVWIAEPPRGLSEKVSGALADVVAQGQRVTLIVPATDVTVLQVEMPHVAASQLARALPYAVEEMLACDPEEVHFSARRLDASTLEVCCINKRRLAAYIGALQQAGARCQEVLSEWDLLEAPAANELRIWSANGTVWIRGGDITPICLSDDNAAVVVPALTAAQSGLKTRFSGNADWLPNNGASVAPAEPFADWRSRYSCNKVAARPDLVGTSVNVYRGEESKKSIGVAATAMMAALLAVAATWAIELSELNQERHDWDARTRQIYHEAFPNEKRVSDVKRQLLLKLRAHTGTAGDADNSALLLLSLLSADAAGVAGISIEEVRFQEDALTVRLRASALAQFTTLTDALKRREGISAELGSAIGTQQGAKATLTIKGT